MRCSSDELASREAICLDVRPVRPTYTFPFTTAGEIGDIDVHPLDIKTCIVQVDLDDLALQLAQRTMGFEG